MARFDPSIHHRRSIRLEGYDYSETGAYFVTIVAHDRMSLFGKIENGQVELSDAGKMLQSQWASLPTRFRRVQLDEFIVMPNHVHGILWIAESWAGTSPAPTASANTKSSSPSLGAVVGAWKSSTTVEYIRGVRQLGWESFENTLWQRNYWEHIVRDELELGRIRLYIFDNPANWDVDKENPQCNRPAPGKSVL